MHELILFGQVPFKQYEQVLKILAGVAAMQPNTVSERHLIFRPTKSSTISGRTTAKPGAPVTQVQALQAQMHGDLFYLQLVGDRTSESPLSSITATIDGDDSTMTGTMLSIDRDINTNGDTGNERDLYVKNRSANFNKYHWSIEFRDLPEVPGRRRVTSRLMASVPITNGNPLHVMHSLGYKYASEYLLQGHQLVHGNIILFLHQAFIVPPQFVANSGTKQSSEPVPSERVPRVQELRPLDSSGSFILQASIRVKDGTKPESMTIGMAELTNFRELVRGIVDLEVVDRLALDTRMK